MKPSSALPWDVVASSSWHSELSFIFLLGTLALSASCYGYLFIQGRARVGLQLWVCKTQSLFLNYYLLITALYSIQTIVYLLLPHPVYTLPAPTRPGASRGQRQLRRTKSALAGVAQWTECLLANQSVASLIPSQGTCLGCGPGPQWGALEKQPHIHVSLPLFLLPSPL